MGMDFFRKSIVGVICLLAIASCRMNKETATSVKPALVVFLDSTKAASAIIQDDKDGFYDQISKLDIEIQMKKTTAFVSRENALTAYKAFLKSEVKSWTTEEKLVMSDIFYKVKKLCDTISPRIFPGDISLIKVKTNHYGKDVYYTRGNNIMVPENIFPSPAVSEQLPVMIHEVFHILSRNNPALRNDLYSLVGFKKADKTVQLNEAVSKKLLTNPDGISYQYLIELEGPNGIEKAIPLITSRFTSYRNDNQMFFDYLNFDLYKLKDQPTAYEVESDAVGKTTIPLNSTPSFFKKIKDNTQYIIHPDEIMADNFMLALQAYSSNDFSKFSTEGKALIDKVIERLQKE